MHYDWLIRGGRVIDPASDLDGIRDVALRDGKIARKDSYLDAYGYIRAMRGS